MPMKDPDFPKLVKVNTRIPLHTEFNSESSSVDLAATRLAHGDSVV